MQAPRAVGHVPPVRVAVADDDALIRRTIVAIVEYEATLELAGVAGHVNGAGRVLGDADVLIADVRMPGGGAVEAARQLRASAADCVVVALTGFDSISDRQQLMEAGVTACLVKGCPIEEIVEAVRTAATAAQANRAGKSCADTSSSTRRLEDDCKRPWASSA
jgi:DNA-binding NarL/FixJ family response regulator